MAKQMHDTRSRDVFDKVILALAFAIGIGGGMVLKIMHFNPLIPAAFSIVVIVAYAFLTFVSKSARLEPDQIGDNAYYLGFVLTLFSLSFTLYELGLATADSDFLRDVISGFGIALSSTIAGVAVRVFMLQFRFDLASREAEARLEINEGMRGLRAQIGDSIRGLKFMGTEVRQSLDEHHQQIAEAQKAQTEKLVSGMLDEFKSAMEEFVRRGQAANEAMSKNTQETVGSSGEALSASMASLKAAVLAATKEMTSALGEVSAATQFAAAGHEKALADHTKHVSSALGASRKVLGKIESEFSSALTRIEERLGETISIADTELMEPRKALNRELTALNKDFGVLRHVIQQHTAATEDTIRKAHGADEMELKLIAAKQKLAEAEQNLVEARKENGRILGMLSVQEIQAASFRVDERSIMTGYTSDGQPIAPDVEPLVDETVVSRTGTN